VNQLFYGDNLAVLRENIDPDTARRADQAGRHQAGGELVVGPRLASAVDADEGGRLADPAAAVRRRLLRGRLPAAAAAILTIGSRPHPMLRWGHGGA